MMGNKVMVIAPHPDDETLGCGGTLLSLKNRGHSINWLIATCVSESEGYSKEKCDNRANEIDGVSQKFGFESVSCLNIPTTQVDKIEKNKLVNRISDILLKIQPNTLFIPYYNDVHTDHQLIAEAAISCTKWFRYPFIKAVLFYEVSSETDMNISSTVKPFKPNVFVDIADQLEGKIEIMKIFESEMGVFPFPRSEKSIRSLAYLRGSQCGAYAAEAFELLTLRVNFEDMVVL